MTDFSEFGKPRPVEGGLRARTARGAIGQSWWSRRFVDVLESFALGTRLTRGRSYARKGQVVSLDIAPGEVTAAVQGSRPKPYAVRVGLRAYPEPVWERIEVLLAVQALYAARLLAGDLPPELEEVFAQAGAPLFPGVVDELRMSCDCPDFAVPCKHLAATFYLLAEAFDADPFQLLHWRGRDRDRLLARLRELRGAQGSVAPVAAATGDPEMAGAGAGAALALADLPHLPLAEAVERFWLPPVPLPSRPPTLDAAPDLLLRQLGPPAAVIGGPGLIERLRRAYERFAARDPAADSPG
ncbi:SWIM zinc finger family protein [Micromonospora sp. NPDC049679]|uniref:SWIM zinc finger family protein n=1 Tax=Micromonospora sp. NPDC049679 TaxID=3155920 RepID=UPI0033E1A651